MYLWAEAQAMECLGLTPSQFIEMYPAEFYRMMRAWKRRENRRKMELGTLVALLRNPHLKADHQKDATDYARQFGYEPEEE